VWETEGDIEAARKIEQDWLQAGEMTRASQEEACTGCESELLDLQNELDECKEELEVYNNMNITINSGCCSDFETQLDENSNEYPLVPLNPNDPFDTIYPTWDNEQQVPPDGYDDWAEFTSQRCLAANWFVDSYIDIVENLDLIERQASIGTAILDIGSLILAALPGRIGNYAGIVVIVRWVSEIVRALTLIVDDLEDFGDWLQVSVDAIEANKEELVCAAYRMSSVEWLQEFFLTFFAGNISPELANAGYSSSVVDGMRAILAPLADGLASKVNSAFSNMNIPVGYLPSFDCSSCEELADGYFLPLPGYRWIKLPMVAAIATTCDAEGSPVTSAGNEDGMQIDRIITGSGISAMGWENMNIPQSVAGIGFDFGAVSYVGNSNQGYGFMVDSGPGIPCDFDPQLLIQTDRKIFLETTDNVGVGNVGQQMVNLEFDAFAEIDWGNWVSLSVWRNTAAQHENHIEIKAIRFLVQE